MRARTVALLLLLVAGLVGCDHATKYAASEELRGEPPVTVVTGAVDLTYAENHNVAFGALEWVPDGFDLPFIVITNLLVLAGLLAVWYRQRRARSWVQLGFALAVAGAIGNLSDRLVRGFVVDFIHVVHWPVFNVADICVVAGALMLMLYIGRRQPATG